MSQDNQSSPIGTVLLTFLAGAAVGAVVVALTTPKTGSELRGDLQAMARRARRKAREAVDDASGVLTDLGNRTASAADDLKRGIVDAAKDLRG